jgi:hypothetical protein
MDRRIRLSHSCNERGVFSLTGGLLDRQAAVVAASSALSYIGVEDIPSSAPRRLDGLDNGARKDG